MLFVAANAAYRAVQQKPDDRRVVVLESVLATYTEVEVSPGFTGAAYNYEYVARICEAVAKGPETVPATADPLLRAFAKPGPAPAAAPAAQIPVVADTDLPAGRLSTAVLVVLRARTSAGSTSSCRAAPRRR